MVTLHESYRAILTGLGRLLPVDIGVHAHWQQCAEVCIGRGDTTSIVALQRLHSAAAPALKLVILLVLVMTVTIMTVTFPKSEMRL